MRAMYGMASSVASKASQPRFGNPTSGASPAAVMPSSEASRFNAKRPAETFELRHAAIRERTAQQEVVRAGVIAQETHLRLAAMPALEDRNLVEQRETGVGHGVAGSQLTQARLPRECTEGTVAGRSALEIHVAEALASGQVRDPSVRDLRPGQRDRLQFRQRPQDFESVIRDTRATQVEVSQP